MSIEILLSEIGIPNEDLLIFPDYVRSRDAHSHDITEEFSFVKRLWVIDGTSAPITAFRLSQDWLKDSELIGLRADFMSLDALANVEFQAFSTVLEGRLVVEYRPTVDSDYLEFYSGTPEVRGKAILRTGLTDRRDLFMISHHALPVQYFQRIILESGRPISELPVDFLGWCTLKSPTSLIPDPQVVQINVGDLFAYRNIPPLLQIEGEMYRKWVLGRLRTVLESFKNLKAIFIPTDKLALMCRGWHIERLDDRDYDELEPLFIPSQFNTCYYIEKPFQTLKSRADFREMGAQRNYFLYLSD